MLYNKSMSISNQIAIITGAGRGVGRATALRFAREGAQLALFSQTPAHLDETVALIKQQGGAQPLTFIGDVASESDVTQFFQQVHNRYGRIDILVNCAGLVIVRPFQEMDSKTWDRVLNVNLRGTYLCCHAAFRLMVDQQQGVIINISSLSGVKGVEKFPGMSAYNVAKAGISSLTEILAVEGRPHNIRVSVVSPGAIDTDMLRVAAPHLKAGMTPEEMADILLFLADDSGKMFTGSNIELFTNA